MKQTILILILCGTYAFVGNYFSNEHTNGVSRKTFSNQFLELHKHLNNAYHKTALKTNEEFNKYSHFNESKLYQILNKRMHYEIVDKQYQILIKRTQLAERNLTIQKQNSKLFFLIASVVTLSFISYLFYNQHKTKNKQLQKQSELRDALIKIENQTTLQDQQLKISKDLHETIGAKLAYLISSLDNIKYSFNITDQKLNNKLTSITNFTSGTIYELRDTLWAMNKTEITFEDLKSRLTNYIKSYTLDGNVSFAFHVDDDIYTIRKLTVIEGLNIYKIIQEAIQSSLIHTKPNTIIVKVEKLNNHLKFTITDDGQGFDVTTLEKGKGWLNMQKRAIDINTKLQIVSNANESPKVIFSI